MLSWRVGISAGPSSFPLTHFIALMKSTLNRKACSPLFTKRAHSEQGMASSERGAAPPSEIQVPRKLSSHPDFDGTGGPSHRRSSMAVLGASMPSSFDHCTVTKVSETQQCGWCTVTGNTDVPGHASTFRNLQQTHALCEETRPPEDPHQGLGRGGRRACPGPTGLLATATSIHATRSAWPSMVLS